MTLALDTSGYVLFDAGFVPAVDRAGNDEVAHGTLIYDARGQAGLTQGALADLISVKDSVIARLEDADYHGDSLALLQRIAIALNRKLDIRLLPEKRRRAA